MEPHTVAGSRTAIRLALHDAICSRAELILMKRRPFLLALGALLLPWRRLRAEAVDPTFRVTLPEAHKGTLEIDTKLLDSYGRPTGSLRQFYLDARAIFQGNSEAAFTDDAILQVAQQHGVLLMGGPLLGDLRADGVSVWLRPSTDQPITVQVGDRTFADRAPVRGEEIRLPITR